MFDPAPGAAAVATATVTSEVVSFLSEVVAQICLDPLRGF